MARRAALDMAFNVWGFLNIAATLFAVFTSSREPRWALILWIVSIGAWLVVERVYYRSRP